MGCLVQDRGRDLGVGKRRVVRERQLYQAESLIGEERAATGIALDENPGEVPPEVPVVMRRVAPNELQRGLHPAQRAAGVDVRPRVDDGARQSVDLPVFGRWAH